MESRVITISDSGAVNVPANVKMTDYEIARLLGIMVSTVKGKIKTLLKSRQFRDCGDGGVVCRNGSIVPDYFGLEMVIAVAFQVDGYEADIFRKWVIRRLTQSNPKQPIYVQMNSRDSVYS
ncbi:MAG: hypothetical protein SNG27_09625 [Rikenellaceae bacterium]